MGVSYPAMLDRVNISDEGEKSRNMEEGWMRPYCCTVG